MTTAENVEIIRKLTPETKSKIGHSVANIIKGSAKTNFSFYRDGNLWYETDQGIQFPVPISDIGSATFLAQDKTILFMRWIRKHVEMVEKSRVAEQNENS